MLNFFFHQRNNELFVSTNSFLLILKVKFFLKNNSAYIDQIIISSFCDVQHVMSDDCILCVNTDRAPRHDARTVRDCVVSLRENVLLSVVFNLLIVMNWTVCVLTDWAVKWRIVVIWSMSEKAEDTMRGNCDVKVVAQWDLLKSHCGYGSLSEFHNISNTWWELQSVVTPNRFGSLGGYVWCLCICAIMFNVFLIILILLL